MTNMKNFSRRLSEATYLKVRIIILQCKQFVIIMKYPIDLANLMTPVVSAILINSTNPFGNIPNKAAAEATTDVLIPASLNQKTYSSTRYVLN